LLFNKKKGSLQFAHVCKKISTTTTKGMFQQASFRDWAVCLFVLRGACPRPIFTGKNDVRVYTVYAFLISHRQFQNMAVPILKPDKGTQYEDFVAGDGPYIG
jgi:hypothetical protein